MSQTPLQQLQAHGQSVWIDYLSRKFVEAASSPASCARA
jgi:hypothetical protein